MKGAIKLFGIIALAAVIGFSMAGCDNGTTSSSGGDGGGGGGGPISLTSGVWKNGEITDPEASIKYTFDVVKYNAYYIWLNDRTTGDGAKTLAADISISYENGANGYYDYGSGLLMATSNGKVIVEVKPLSSSLFQTGTFAIAYTDGAASSMPAYPLFNPPNPVALTANTWFDGEITDAADNNWYSFDVTSGQTYYVWWNENGYVGGNSSKTLDIKVDAYYSNGTSIFVNIETAWGTPQTFTPTSNTKVYIKVVPSSSLYSPAGTGTYGIVYSTNDTKPSTMNFSSAIPLQLGLWAGGEITALDSEVLYSVTSESSGSTSHYFWWNDSVQGNGSATLDVEVSAFRSSESSFFSITDSGWTSSKSGYLSSGETIYIKVVPKIPGSEGTFDIVCNASSTKPWLAPASAPVLAEGQWADGEILSGSINEVWYSFDVTSGIPYYIWWNNKYQGSGITVKTLNSYVTAFDGEGTPIFTDASSGWTTPKSFTPEADDTIYVKVIPSYSSYNGTFGVVFTEDNDSRPSTVDFSDAVPLEIDQWENGEIAASDSEVWYSVTAASTNTHRLWWNDSAQGNGAKTLDIQVSAFRNTEESIFANIDSSWNSSQSCSLSSGETIYIRVTPKISGSEGTFGITHSTSTTRPWLIPVNAQELSEGQWTDGEILSGSDGEVWYSFDVISGIPYYVWWKDKYQGNNTKTLNVMVRAYYSDGTSFFPSTSSGWSSPQTVTPTLSDTIYVRVYPYYSGDTGTFGIVYNEDNDTRPLCLPDDVISLTQGQWEDSSITSDSNGEKWFSFEALSGITYRVWWNGWWYGDVTKTLNVKASAYYSNGTSIFTDVNSGWTAPQYFTPTSDDTIYVLITPNTSGTGTFGVVYGTSSSKPSL